MQGEGIMTCTHAKQLMVDTWMLEPPGDSPEAAALEQHLAACPECGAEMATLSGLWHRLGDMPLPEPSPALDARWQSSFEALLSAQKPVAAQSSPRFAWRFWPRNPVWQVGLAMACLIAGVLVGTRMERQSNEIAQLHQEIASTRAMVALSLMQQESTTERLRGVSYTGSMSTMEPEVLSALTDAVAHDSSVNVRLAAIDALTKASGRPHVLQSLTQSLPREDSPMVQAALIDYLIDARDRGALGTLRQFAAQPDVNPAVLERAHFAVQQLSK
jgi:hypothetical protein